MTGVLYKPASHSPSGFSEVPSHPSVPLGRAVSKRTLAVTGEWPPGHSQVRHGGLGTSLFTSGGGLSPHICKDGRGQSWQGCVSVWWQKYPPHTGSLALRIVIIKIIPANPYIMLAVQSLFHILTHLNLITSKPNEVGRIFILILQIKKLRQKRVRDFPQGLSVAELGWLWSPHSCSVYHTVPASSIPRFPLTWK